MTHSQRIGVPDIAELTAIFTRLWYPKSGLHHYLRKLDLSDSPEPGAVGMALAACGREIPVILTGLRACTLGQVREHGRACRACRDAFYKDVHVGYRAWMAQFGRHHDRHGVPGDPPGAAVRQSEPKEAGPG